MFTGIVSDLGVVASVKPARGMTRLRISCRYPARSIALGASILCDGICLTVVAKGGGAKGGWFEVEAGAETLKVTTLARWQAGKKVNLERALKVGDELGGHIVSGHVDGVARVVLRENTGDMARIRLRAPKALSRFIAPKGSVALDGISLTVNEVEGDEFGVFIIPHTLAVTSWKTIAPGAEVNLEVDMMARYAARLAEKSAAL
ncbi:MAG TPA: riboflavin synthase [Xanthobacteraceae bacterium]|nr:riboflavin synthase [Xanthobacteraceae bacterium]